MKVTVDVKIDYAALAKIALAQEATIPKLLDAFQTEIMTAAVVPRDLGDLEESIYHGYAVMGGKIVAWIGWDTPYARRLFYHPEYNFRQDKNANAQGRWTDPWVFGSRSNWLPSAFMTFLKMESGGVIT